MPELRFETPYSGYDVLAKWDSPSFNDRTRRVIADRLSPPPRRFFTVAEWTLLAAIVARLLPQPERSIPIPITPWIDDALAANRGEGFRYEDMPEPRCAWQAGLAGVAAESRRRHGCDFVDLAPGQQDALLGAVQLGEVDAAPSSGLSFAQFFSQVLLKTVAGLYYSHPAAWSEIGFGGPASPRGYVRIEPGRIDPWEAEEAQGD